MTRIPRYDGPAVIDLGDVVVDPSGALSAQHARFSQVLADLSPKEWAAPSRCAGWSVQDVVEHLVQANAFWTRSVSASLAGNPTRMLRSFDPVSVPAAMVASVRGRPVAATLSEFVESTHALGGLLSGLPPHSWSLQAEAPPGHLALRAVAAHALWDAWIHERDVVVALGRPTTVEPGEVEAVLAYAIAIVPAFAVTSGAPWSGSLQVVAHDPEVRLNVEVGEVVSVRSGAAAPPAVRVEGDASSLVEGFSGRGDPPAVTDGRRRLGYGLASAFTRKA